MASDLLSAGATIMSGRAQARQAVTEAALAERQAKDVDLQALQMSERRREDFRAAVSAYETQRIARGASLDSPTGQAIERELKRQAVREEGVDRLGYRNQADALRMQAAAGRKGARNAMTASYLSAAGTVWDAGQKAYSARGGR